ncbi:hotdog domain-containing protein [Pseudomonas sp. 2835]|uniref:hotdog domain-containing protein n=1 Tax=Pseudomonas sp. 2835 TaxID=3156451 RepID=UPI003D1EB107
MNERLDLASRCAQALFERDPASQGMGMRLLAAGPGCGIDYVTPAHLDDTLTATCREQSRSGRTGNYAVRIENPRGQLIALFHGKPYKVRGTVLPEEPQA